MEELNYELARAKVIEMVKKIKKSISHEGIRKSYSSILTILTHYQSIIEDIDINSLKENGLKYATNEFLELLSLINLSSVNIIFDSETIKILNALIYEYLQKEYTSINKENIEQNTILSDQDSKDNFSLKMSFENDRSNETEQDAFYIDYIDDPAIICIFEIFTKFFFETKNIYLLRLLHEYGFFDLTSIIVTDNLCKLIQNIFKDKVYKKNRTDDTIRVLNEPSSLIEIQSKYFESHTIVKNKMFIDEYVFKDDSIFVDDSVYCIIAQEFFNRNISFFIKEIGAMKIIHLILFWLDYNLNTMENKIDEILTIFYNDDVITELKESLFKDENIYIFRLYTFLLRHLSSHQNSKILFCKLVLELTVVTKLVKLNQQLDIKHKKSFFLFLNTLFTQIEKYQNDFEDHINLKEYIKSSKILLDLKSIIDLLNYKFDEVKDIINLIKLIYMNSPKVGFYKVSYYLIYRHVIMKYDSDFAFLLFSDIIKFHQSSIYNFPKIFFNNVKKDKGIKSEIENEQVMGSNDLDKENEINLNEI